MIYELYDKHMCLPFKARYRVYFKSFYVSYSTHVYYKRNRRWVYYMENKQCHVINKYIELKLYIPAKNVN